MKEVTIYTDGACSGNPGPGGWAAVLLYMDNTRKISGFCENTTNNRMELTAVIEGLKVLKFPCSIKLYSDSAYVTNAFLNNWIKKWQTNGWKTSSGVVQNQDLWKELLALTNTHTVQFIKVKGHADNEYNNECDKMAVREIKQNINL